MDIVGRKVNLREIEGKERERCLKNVANVFHISSGDFDLIILNLIIRPFRNNIWFPKTAQKILKKQNYGRLRSQHPLTKNLTDHFVLGYFIIFMCEGKGWGPPKSV